MVKKLFEWVISPMGRIAVLIGMVAVLSLGAYGVYASQQAPEQPIQFRHDVHVNLGVQCLHLSWRLLDTFDLNRPGIPGDSIL